MQNGVVSTKPEHILLVMPWPAYRNIYENNLVAIYQYLSAIPPAKPGGTCTGQGQTGHSLLLGPSLPRVREPYAGGGSRCTTNFRESLKLNWS